MKVYFVVKEPSERTINHFVSSLGKALQKQGCEVVYGLDRLWMDEVLECDIVHFQWPEGIFGLFGHQVTDEELTRVNQRLAWLKENGKRIFYTCHNLKPHTNRALGVLRLYDIIYSHADTIVHLGQYSCELLQPQYPNAHHIVIPHHIYDNMLPFSFSQQEARQRLHLPQGRKIILSFGKFRNDQERNFVLNVKKQIEALSLKAEANSKLYTLNSTLFLMPGFYRETLHTLNPKKFITRLYHTLCYKLKGIQFSNDVIPDDLMQCYFCAADVVLIQRLDILNSGNLPMAFAAGKVVVGPNAGNVGEILRDTGNFTFDSEYTESAISALQSALNATSKGKDNKTYAAKHWSSDIIATKLLRCYQKTITTNLIIDRNKNIYEMTDKVFNTGETQSELTAKYNPEGSILRRAQMRMLDMLLYFDIVCKEQNIPYRIDGGNVLGAVRHGGFIPWDDDIDVVIMRKDLHRLCDYLIKNPHPQYKLQTFNTDYGYVGAWVVLRDTKSEYFQDSVVHNARKYRGLQIDIFPYENRVIKNLHRFSAKITKYNGKWFVGKHMRVARIIFVLQHRILHPIFRAIGRLFGAPDIYMYPYGARIFRSHTSKSQFPYKDISFEGHLFPGPADPDLFCKEFYGERYMDLPDVSNRNHHKATYRIED